MSHNITLTPEDHGYTIRLEKRTFTDGGKKEVSETVATLAIIWDYKEAHAAFDALNTLVSVCVENKILAKDQFRYRKSK